MKKFYFLAFLFLYSFFSLGQTKGLIYKPASTPAGRAILDPNLDGYTSTTTNGFKTNDWGNGESEINFKAIPILENEPIQDPLRGPACGFTDMVDSGVGDPVMFYFDGTNFLVRFRLNKTSPNSKGYSVLIDTDQKFGFNGPNADPNAVAGNPGFELELVLKTNHGVGLYNVNGALNPALIVDQDYESHSQKSIAYTENCGDSDYFYDFYLPWSDFGLPVGTKLRMVALTVMSPQPAIGNNAKSDVAGVDDRKYNGNYDKLFEDFIQNYNPTSPQDNNAGLKARTLCPTVNASLLVTSTAITGTSTEAAGTIITVYRNNIALVDKPFVAANGTWSLAVSGLKEGDVITASAKASGKEESESNCSGVLVGQVCTRPVAPTLTGSNGNSNKYITITATATGLLDLYLGDQVLVSKAAVTAGNTYYYCPAAPNLTSRSNDCSGGNNLTPGVYRSTLTVGSCASNSAFLCVNTTTASATPVVYSPVTTLSRIISGTAAANAQVILKVNNAEKVRVTADASGAWLVPAASLGLTETDKISAYALETGKCQSAETAQIAITKPVAVAPVITGNYCGAITRVTGTSSEAAGTIIKVFIGASATPAGTTTTNEAGNWEITNLSVSPGSQITAKATASGKTESVASAAVTVKAASSNAGITILGTTDPLTAGSYISENASLISGTRPDGTGLVSLYLDEMFIGSGTLAGRVWTVKKTDFQHDFYLFAGAKVTATFTATGGCESDHTPATVAIRCAPPIEKEITPTSMIVCTDTKPEVSVKASEALVIYQLYHGAEPIGSSVLGTGADILLKATTPLIASTPNTIVNLRVIASKIPYVQGVNCELPLTQQVAVTINPEIKDNTISLAGTSPDVCGPANLGSITGSTPTGGNNSYTYQWQTSPDNTTWSDIEAATAQDYNPGVVAVTTYYRRKVLSGACSNADASASLKITVNTAITNTLTYNGQTSFCVSANPTEIRGNTNASYRGYQWQSSPDGISFANINSATTAHYKPGNLTQTTTFRRVVYTGTCESYSAPLTFNIYSAIANNQITASSTSILCSIGNTGEIIGSAPTGGDNTYTYKWQQSTNNGFSFADISPAVTTPNYTPGAIAITTYFRRIITSGPCDNSESNVVKITVVSVAKTTITADESTLAANGASRTTIRVQLKDEFETEVSTNSCHLNLTTNYGTISNIQNAGPGVYTATLTAGTAAGVASITGTLNGAAIMDNAEVTFVPAVNLASTSVTVNPVVVYADGLSTALATVAFKDYAGNAVAVHAAQVALLIDGVAVVAEDKGNGVFTATIPARNLPATVEVTAKYNAIEVGNKASVRFEPVPVVIPTVSLTATTVTATPEQVAADGRSTATVEVQFKAANGTDLAVDETKVQIYLDEVAVSFNNKGNGRYEVIVPASLAAGTVQVTAKYDGGSLTSTASVRFVPTINLAATVLSATPARVNADGVSTSTVQLAFKDYAGNPVAVAANTVGILIDGTAAILQPGATGVFAATVPARTTAATATITAVYNETALNSNATVTFVPVVNLAATEITATPTRVNADRTSTAMVRVKFKDFAGKNIAVDVAQVSLYADGVALAGLQDKGNGVFEAIVPARNVAGTVEITATYNGAALSSNAEVVFVPVSAPVLSLDNSAVEASPLIVPADGVSTSVITVRLKDTNNNNFITSEPVIITSNFGMVQTVIQDAAGNYTTTIRSATTGIATITAKVGAAELTAKPVITFVPGKASEVTSTIVASAPTIAADGTSTVVITITLFDAQGNRITSGDNTVVITSTMGTLAEVSKNPDGTYTMVLTSGTTPGTAVISGTLNGTAIQGTTNVVFSGITVVNHPPVATNDSFTVNNHEKLTGNVLLNDNDADQLSVKTMLVRQPLYGTVRMLADGNFTYTPNKGYTGEDSFTYEVCDNNSPANCAQATVTIQVLQGQVFIPEAFSPDGDGQNDVFVIYGAEKYQVSLKVLNRWGDIVYQNKTYKNDWNGKANSGVVFGDKLPDGTYYYIVDLNNGERPRMHALIIKRK